VTLWDPDEEVWVIRAGAGLGLRVVGERIEHGDNASSRAAREHRPVLVRTGTQKGLSPLARETEAQLAWVLSVPLPVDGMPRITFQADWFDRPSEAETHQVLAVIEKLGALTTLAYRAEEERAHRAQAALLRSIIEAVPDAVWIQHRDSTTLNAAARRLLRQDEASMPRGDEFAPRRLDGTPASPDEWPGRVALRTGKPTSGRMLLRVGGGEDRVIELKTAPIPDGFVALARDLTEEHREHVLTRNFLERLFESLPVAAGVADAATGEVLSVNQAFQDLVGLEPEQIVGAQRPYPWWAEQQPEWEPEGRYDGLVRRSDGRLVPVDGRAFEIADDEGGARRRVVLITDLTERYEFERQIAQSGKLAAIGELASGVAHEINNPLFAILGLVEFLLRDAEEGSKSHERLLLIQQTGLEIKEIVKALLDFARERTDEHKPMLVREAVADAVALFKRTSAAKSLEIVECYSEEPRHVLGSPNQIKQIVLNLISNAQQAMPDGGAVTVDVRRQEDEIVVEVTDTGPGIPPNVLPRIFEPFFTTKRDLGGTGLGLAVSHGIAEMHGGTLTAESDPGSGATLQLALPVAPPEAA
jgi:PAS domain S-box-containing protein